jgi:asparagine synthase (glutamine-hydrolysing)
MRGRLPAATLRGPKRGFGVPVSEWLRTDLRPLLEQSLLGEQWLLRGYLLPGATRRLVAEHLQGAADHGRELWALLCLELWHQQFVD